MDTTAIKQEINDNIKPNGVRAITGQVLNETLNDIVDAVNQEKQDAVHGTYRHLVWIDQDGNLSDSGIVSNTIPRTHFVEDIEDIQPETLSNINEGDTVIWFRGANNFKKAFIVTEKMDMTFSFKLVNIDGEKITTVSYSGAQYQSTSVFSML